MAKLFLHVALASGILLSHLIPACCIVYRKLGKERGRAICASTGIDERSRAAP